MIKEFEIFDTKTFTGAVHNGKICIDTKLLFNKPKSCPIQLPYPKTPDEIKQFIEAIEWLSTDEAQFISKHILQDKFIIEYK